MVRGDAAETRKQRQEEMARFIQSSLLANEGEIPYTKTIAALSYKMGLRKERIKEYLDILEEIGQFTIDREADKIEKISES